LEYLEDGFTKNLSKKLKQNPNGLKLRYRDALYYKGVPLSYKLKAIIRLIQCHLYSLIK